tara:strand:- start:232 stop:663 length:432 start_codon:yes stop_codon:yes gene_type:complete
MVLNPKVWGPHYWFVLHTIANTYPLAPNDVTKKKYYDFIQNLPLLLPIEEIGNSFAKYLDKYPVTPYLDSRPSFMKWMHFIHNKINVSIGEPELSMEESMAQYYEEYKPKVVKDAEQRKQREKLIFLLILLFLLIIGGILYNK